MKPAQIAVICLAAVAAIALVVVMRMMGSSPATETPKDVAIQSEPSVQVLVANKELLPGHRLTDADLGWKPWAVKDLNPLYVTDGAAPAVAPKPNAVQKVAEKAGEAVAPGPVTGTKAEYVGAIVKETILAGEPIVARKIVRVGEAGYLAAFLEPGEKAMSIKVSVESTAGGFILPGDRVDVILSRQVKDKDADGSEVSRNVVSTVLRNLKVLAIDQAVNPPAEDMSLIGATATLALTAADAEVLSLARAEGELLLVLRSYADAGDPSGRVAGAIRSGGRRVAAPAAAAAAPQGQTVTIYRKGAAEVVTVS